MNKYKIAALASVIIMATSSAQADCPIDGAKPINIGSINPQNGFPQWIQDINGTSLEMCLDAGTNCTFDPVADNNPFSEQIGFGAEAFWWMADASINTNSGLSATLVQAVEAAFATESPADGDQFPFTRLRIRVDVPMAGIYTITHPFGQRVFEVESVGAKREINDTIDMAFDANSQHQGRIGPFLKSTSAPQGFLGNGTATTVTGSPCGTNFFRIEGVAKDGTPLNLDGAGGNVVQTDQFTVIGKLYSGVTNTPLSIDRATYSRTTTGQVDIFASAPASATVTFSGESNLPTNNMPLIGDNNGHFAAHIPLSNAEKLPSNIKVSAKTASNAQTTLVKALTDNITISRAVYNTGTSTLVVNASSSDQSSIAPILTVANIGVMAKGALSQKRPFAPAFVTVTSSAGGSATLPVTFTGLTIPNTNTPPVATNDSAETFSGVPVIINVLKNDTDADNDPLRVTSTTQGKNGSVAFVDKTITYIPSSGFIGTDQFTYTIQDVKGAQVTATITVIVKATSTSEALTTLGLECRTSRQEWRVAGTSSAAAGTIISLFSGTTVATGSKISETTVDNLGNWTIRERQAPIACSTPVSLTSSTGAILENVAVRIRN